MGMYSWLCKGCQHELNMGEFVRLAGSNQIYDGYGGSSGRAEIYSPSTWHVRCYNNAPVEQKLDDSPGKHAPDQGMGFAKLVNMQDYDPTLPIKYSAVIYCSVFADERKEWQFFLTANGLEDFLSYQQKYEKVFENLCAAEKPDSGEAFYREVQKQAEALMGGPNPQRSYLEFDDMGLCMASADALLSTLPTESNGDYHLAIFGKQGKTEGVVYERKVRQAWDRRGGYENWKELPTKEIEIYSAKI